MADIDLLVGVPAFRSWVEEGFTAKVISEKLAAAGLTGYSVDAVKRARSRLRDCIDRGSPASRPPVPFSLLDPPFALSDPFVPPVEMMSGKVVFLPDWHVPEMDNEAFQAALRFIRDYEPDRVYSLGDAIDNPQLSRFSRDPKRVLGLQDDIDALTEAWSDLRWAVGKECELVWIEGNHEARLVRWLWEHPEVSQLRGMQPEQLFRTVELGIRYVRTDIDEELGGWTIKHGDLVRKWSGWSGKAEHERLGVSGISGHTHRAGVFCHRKGSQVWTWIEAGCLCKLEPAYMRHPDWQHGFVYGRVEDGRLYASLATIENGKITSA